MQRGHDMAIISKKRKKILMAHSKQLRPRIGTEAVVMEEDLGRKERVSSSDHDNAIEDALMDDSERDSDTEEEMRSKSP